MRFEWDERKRRANIRKHGFDFADAFRVFEGTTLTILDEREDYNEIRWVTLGLLDEVVVVVVHTESARSLRIISLRKATRGEIEIYFSQIGN